MSKRTGSLTYAAAPATTATSAPLWILRHHAPSPVHAVRLLRLRAEGGATESSSLFVLAGDAQGRVSLTLLADLRPRYFWKAHEQGVLGLDVVQLSVEGDGSTEAGVALMTHGRDNKVHIFTLQTINTLCSLNHILPSRIEHDLPVPERLASLDINALNYCPMSVLHCKQPGDHLLAVPHTLDSGYADVLRLPSASAVERIAKAVGKADIQSAGANQRAPMCMTMHLLPPSAAQADGQQERFRLLAGYEDGYMRMWSVGHDGRSTLEWNRREHSESIMASCVSLTTQTAYSVAADDRIVGYNCNSGAQVLDAKCRSMGNASVAIRHEGVCLAVGGWDGVVRLYDESLQHTSSFRYHKETVQALSFLESRAIRERDKDECVAETVLLDSDDEDDGYGARTLGNVADEHLLVSGGKEGRICIWSVDRL